MNPGSEILVSHADRIVWVRVEGKGSSTNSTALRDFAKEMIHRGAREFIVDLCNCPVMDSTFMGTLAGISLSLRCGLLPPVLEELACPFLWRSRVR